MNSIQIHLLKFSASFLCAVLVGIVSTSPVDAQYGNLISKAAAEALAAGQPKLCLDEMKALTDIDGKNAAAHLEKARCNFITAVGNGFAERKTKELIAAGKSPADAKNALALLREYALTDAMIEIRYALAINTASSPAYNLRGAVYRAQGGNKIAEADFNLAIRLDPENFRAYANRGRLYDDLNSAAEAVADYEKAIALGMNDPSIKQRISELKQKTSQAQNGTTVGTAANSKKASAQPESELEKVMREEGIVISDEQKAQNKKDAALMTEGLLKPGNLEKVNNALKNVNETPLAQNKMTELFLRKQGISKKFAEFQTAYAKPLGDSQKLEMLGRIKSEYQAALTEAENAERQNLNYSAEQKKQIAEYKNYYSKALGILGGMSTGNQPTAAKTGESPQSSVAQSVRQTPDYATAAAKLTTRIAATPNDDNLYAQRGMAYLRLKKYDEALADGEKAVQLNPKSANAFILRGAAKTEKLDYDGAITDYTQSIKLAPNQGIAYIGRGTAYERKQDYDLAIADYTKAAEVDPKAAQMANNKRISADSEQRIAKAFGSGKDPYSKAYKRFETENDALRDKIAEMLAKRVYNKGNTTTAQKIQELQELFPLYQKQWDVNTRALAELPKFNEPTWEQIHKKFFVGNIARIDEDVDAARRAIKKLELEIK